jgi:hypothetical protein
LIGLGVAALVLCLVRPLGPLWVAANLVALGAYMGPRRLLTAVSDDRGGAAVAGGLILAGLAASAAWHQLTVPAAYYHLQELPGYVVQAVLYVPETVGESFGVFGWGGELMPRALYALGIVLLALMFWSATRAGNRRQRLFVDGLLVACAVVALVVADAVLLPSGFPLQGRQVLPFFVAFPLWAVEVICRRRVLHPERFGRTLAIVSGGCVALLVGGWLTIAHRVAVGSAGPWFFWPSALWQPLAGWAAPTLLLVAGAVAIISAMLGGSLRPNLERNVKIGVGEEEREYNPAQ